MHLLMSLLVLTVVAGNDDLFGIIDENLVSYSPFYGLIATASAENSTTLCVNHLNKTATAIVNKDKWAIKSEISIETIQPLTNMAVKC